MIMEHKYYNTEYNFEMIDANLNLVDISLSCAIRFHRCFCFSDLSASSRQDRTNRIATDILENQHRAQIILRRSF